MQVKPNIAHSEEMISRDFETFEDFEEMISSKDIEMSEIIVNKILSNINSDIKDVYITEIRILDKGVAFDLNVERKDFQKVLESNLNIFTHHERYEECRLISNAINFLKK